MLSSSTVRSCLLAFVALAAAPVSGSAMAATEEFGLRDGLEQANAQPDTTIARQLHPLRSSCTDGYPMHHMSRCDTTTGGPSGSLF